METNGRNLKITIVGANQSGKTALTVRFLTGKFIYEYSSGHNFVYQHNYMMDSTVVPMEIVDTSGDNGISEAVEGSNGVVIVYAINCGKSFQKAREILSKMMNDKSENEPYIALVGNKSDLWPYKSVGSDDGKELADEYMCEYFELSALSCREGVREMFSSVIQITIAKSKPRSLSLPVHLLRPAVESTIMKKLSLEESGRSASLINIQSDKVKAIQDEMKTLPRSNSLACRKFFDKDDEKQCFCQPASSSSTHELASKNVLSSSSTHQLASKEALYSSAVELTPKTKDVEKAPTKIMRRTVSEISHSEKKPTVENKTGILHKTLGDVGFLALSTLQLPVTPVKEKRSRSPFSKRRSDAGFLPRPLLVGKTK